MTKPSWILLFMLICIISCDIRSNKGLYYFKKWTSISIEDNIVNSWHEDFTLGAFGSDSYFKYYYELDSIGYENLMNQIVLEKHLISNKPLISSSVIQKGHQFYWYTKSDQMIFIDCSIGSQLTRTINIDSKTKILTIFLRYI